MSSRKLVLLLLALLIAVGAIVMARRALSPAEEAAKVEEPQGPQVLVAARDLPAGSLLKDSDTKWQVWSGEVKDHMLTKETADKDSYSGALTRGPLRAGDPIIATKVFRTHEQGFLSAALAPGMRAISIKITPVSGLAGLVFPGDHVDVIVAHNVPVPGSDGQNRDRRVSETVVTNARVLGLDQKTDEKVTDPKIADVATLEVTPKDAEKIALIADWNSTLSLVLRSLSDNVASGPAVPAGDPAAPIAPAPDAMPGISVTAPATDARQAAPRSASFTWDSDVSRVLQRPNATNSSRRVMIIRGKDSNEVSFEQ